MTSTERPFRFGVVGAPHGGAAAWRELVARVADRGYTSLLMPDGMQLPAPFPSLATAAALAPLRVGTFVLAAPLRPPASAAWEDGDERRTPVLMAVGGPQARTLAAEKADIVTIAAGALVARDDIGAHLADVRARAGDRAEMAGELERRRAEYGLSYLAVNAEFLDALAPVVERLAGK